MSTKIKLLMPAITTMLIVTVASLVAYVQAQSENMTMEELTNASLAQFPDTLENETSMEEETNTLVGNMTGNATSQNMTYGNMTT